MDLYDNEYLKNISKLEQQIVEEKKHMLKEYSSFLKKKHKIDSKNVFLIVSYHADEYPDYWSYQVLHILKEDLTESISSTCIYDRYGDRSIETPFTDMFIHEQNIMYNYLPWSIQEVLDEY